MIGCHFQAYRRQVWIYHKSEQLQFGFRTHSDTLINELSWKSKRHVAREKKRECVEKNESNRERTE